MKAVSSQGLIDTHRDGKYGTEQVRNINQYPVPSIKQAGQEVA